MKIPEIYHSALKDELDVGRELDYFSNGDSHVFSHNINDGLLPIFKESDCIYSELAWRNGYELFQIRAGNDAKKVTFKQYLLNVENIIEKLQKPTFIIGGKHMLKTLDPPNHSEIKLNGFKAMLMMWNTDSISAPTVEILLSCLRDYYNFKKPLDFCAGYGEHLSKFKSFIGCDINKKCIYFMAKNYLGYND